MRRIVKCAGVAALAAGALVAATAANAGYFGPDYPDQSGVSYGLLPPQAYQAYAFAPGSRRAHRGGTCWVSTFDSKGYGYFGSCASRNLDLDADTLGQARPNKTFVRP